MPTATHDPVTAARLRTAQPVDMFTPSSPFPPDRTPTLLDLFPAGAVATVSHSGPVVVHVCDARGVPFEVKQQAPGKDLWLPGGKITREGAAKLAEVLARYSRSGILSEGEDHDESV